MPDPVVDLEMLIRTRHAIVTLQAVEEAFATRCILEAASHLDLGVMEWTASDGLHRVSPTPLGTLAEKVADLRAWAEDRCVPAD